MARLNWKRVNDEKKVRDHGREPVNDLDRDLARGATPDYSKRSGSHRGASGRAPAKRRR